MENRVVFVSPVGLYNSELQFGLNTLATVTLLADGGLGTSFLFRPKFLSLLGASSDDLVATTLRPHKAGARGKCGFGCYAAPPKGLDVFD